MSLDVDKCPNINWGNSWSLFPQIFLLVFFFFSVFIKPIFQLVYMSHSCWISCSRFLVFFTLKVSINILSNSEILSSVVSSLLMSPPKALSHFFYIFCFVAFLFYSFLGFPSLCLYYPSVFKCGILFFLRTHTMLIIVVLSSWSDSFTIPAIYAFGSDGYCSQTVSFLFSMPCNFLIEISHDMLGKRNSDNRI